MRRLNEIPGRAPERCVLAIGNFDAVHLGHQNLLARLHFHSKSLGLPAVVLTFHPHPRVVLQPGTVVPSILTTEERFEVFQALGLDLWVDQAFDLDLASRPGRWFFDEKIQKGLAPRMLVLGSDFRMGSKRDTGVVELRQWISSAGGDLDVVALQQDDDAGPISTSKIRAAVTRGECENVLRMMGRPFVYTGKVERGQGKGRTIGVPTVNFPRPISKVALPRGVYATQVEWGGRCWRAATNVGIRPTVDPKNSIDIVETHLLDFDGGELYDETICVEFLTFLRPERRFDSFDLLKNQIEKDLLCAREFKASA